MSSIWTAVLIAMIFEFGVFICLASCINWYDVREQRRINAAIRDLEERAHAVQVIT